MVAYHHVEEYNFYIFFIIVNYDIQHIFEQIAKQTIIHKFIIVQFSLDN